MFIARRSVIRSASLIAAVCVAAWHSPAAFAQTAFTYQGLLKSGGTAYSGTADLRFTLYDAAAGGSVIGAPVDVIGASATDGVFTAELDFGALAFDGSPRWLEIQVATPSGGTLAPLSPRQPVNPAPYAMHAAVAGLVPDAALNGTYSNALSMTNAGNVFAGDGSGLGGLNASAISAGTLGDAHLGGTYSNAVSLTSASNSFAGDGSGLTNLDWSSLVSVPAGFADGIDDVGVGTSQWGGTSPNSIYYLPGASSGVGIGTNAPNGRLNVVGGPTWTSNGWIKALNIPTVSAIELGGGGATKYGVGSSLNGLYFFTTTTENADVAASYFMTANANGQVGIGPGGFAPHPSARLHVLATSNDAIIAQTSGSGKSVVGSTTGAGTGVWGEAFGAGSRGGAFWTNNGFCALSGDYTSAATYGLIGTANEGIYGNGGSLGKVGITGVAGGSSSGIVASHVGSSTSAAGLFGNSLASSGNGVIGEANTGTAAYGVWGRAAQGIGGYFSGGTYALVAAGKARVNTIEIIGGSDLAEPFDVAHVDEQGSEQDIEPGMVVVIDPANPGSLMVSTTANDRKVAGIISGANDLAPGMVMKSEGAAHADGDHPVALTGRVWCWCDSDTSAIEPGDMLTTSDTPGHAMKVVDLAQAQGAIIGKAMTPLAAGERGLVMVLVNLQ